MTDIELKFEGQYANIPLGIRDGLDNYINKRLRPGGFLRAVIENNLSVALFSSDLASRRELYNIMMWFQWNAPYQCWGSPERLRAWLSRKDEVSKCQKEN